MQAILSLLTGKDSGTMETVREIEVIRRTNDPIASTGSGWRAKVRASKAT